MYYKFGTSGFRYKSHILLEIAFRIGQYLSYLSSKNDKYIGVIITASHNHYTDNGVKIINYNGNLLNEIHEFECMQFVNQEIKLTLSKGIPKILISMDTRRSGPLIKSMIIKGIYSICEDSEIIDLQYCSTPKMHYEVYSINNNLEISYEQYYFSQIDISKQNVIVDCANGVGSIILKDLKYNNLVNILTNKYHLLNNSCGSDFICTNNTFPNFNYKDTSKLNNTLYSALDGDADRCIFFYENENRDFILLNGDYISALYCYFLNQIYDDEIHFVHTSYTNKGLIHYLHSLNIKTICVATGVKNLQREVIHYNLGVYFESNGHGSIHYNQKIIDELIPEIIAKEQIVEKEEEVIEKQEEEVIEKQEEEQIGENDKLKKLLKMQSLFTGDALSHVFGVQYILNELNMTKEDWYNLYKIHKNKLYKINVKDKNIYKCDKNETELVEPLEIKNKINEFMEKYKCFIFVRPSGTEEVLRIYIEENKLKHEINFEVILEELREILV